MPTPTSKKFERLGMKLKLTDGIAEVVHYKDARCVTVRFLETGTEATTTWQNIINGNIRDNKTEYTSPTQKRLHSIYQRLLRMNVKIWETEQAFFEWAYDRLTETALPRLFELDGKYYLIPENLDLDYSVTIAMNAEVDNLSALRKHMDEYLAHITQVLGTKHNKPVADFLIKQHNEFIKSFFDND